MFPPVPAGAHPVAAQLQSGPGESERHRLGGKRVQEGRHVRSGDQRHDHEQSEQRNELDSRPGDRWLNCGSLLPPAGEPLHPRHRLPGLWEPGVRHPRSHPVCLQVQLAASLDGNGYIKRLFYLLQAGSVQRPGPAALALGQRAAVRGAGGRAGIGHPGHHHGDSQLPGAHLPHLALLFPAECGREDLQTGERDESM